MHVANKSLTSIAGLRSIDLVNIGNLSLVRESFELSQQASLVKISVRNSSIDVLPSFAFGGSAEEISLESTRVNRISAFAFVNLINTKSLRLKDCTIERIDSQAMKKFEVDYVHVIGGVFGAEQVPSRTMNDIQVRHKFLLDSVRLGIVRSEAFVIRRSKIVVVQNCAVKGVESQGFDVTTRGTVIIQNNSFESLGNGAFLGKTITTLTAVKKSIIITKTLKIKKQIYSLVSGITADSELAKLEEERPALRFSNNTIQNLDEGSLMFDRGSFHTELSNILINRPCDCEQLVIWRNNIVNYTNAYAKFYSRQSADETVSQRRVILLPGDDDLPANIEDSFLCLNDDGGVGVANILDFEAEHCASLGGNKLYYGIAAVIGLLVLIGLTSCLLIWCCRRHRDNDRKQWISVPTSAPDVVGNKKKKNGVIRRDGGAGGGNSSGPVDSRITMVVPDGRLYRETEFHVIVEKAEPLTTEL